MAEPTRLHPSDVEAIARRSAELVLEAIADVREQTAPSDLIDAAAVAARFGVDRGWVCAHADELGVVRLGGGSRPRLRFDPDRVLAALARRRRDDDIARQQTPDVARSPVRRRRRAVAAGAGLLPIRDRAA